MRWRDLQGQSAAARPQQFTAFGAGSAAIDPVTPGGRCQPNGATFETDVPFGIGSIAGNDCFKLEKPANAAGRLALQPAGRDPNCASKRVVDFVLALIGIVVFLPLFVAVAIAVKIETPGPVLFRQWRGGQNGKCFRILKFRTMTCMEDGVEVCQARSGDPRVTRVGRVLRRTSVDELPQLFNVVSGDMSLVGPRPHALLHDAMYSKLIAAYVDRQAVRPGITGWAQVNGCRGETRSMTAMERRVQRDLQYIRRWSLWLDVVILARTAVEILRDKNAC